MDEDTPTMFRHAYAIFGMGYTAFDDAISKTTILATLNTVLTLLPLWKSRTSITSVEFAMSLTSVLAIWASVSIIRELRETQIPGWHIFDFDRDSYSDYMRDRMWKAALLDADAKRENEKVRRSSTLRKRREWTDEEMRQGSILRKTAVEVEDWNAQGLP